MKKVLRYSCGFGLLFIAWCFFHSYQQEISVKTTAIPFLNSAMQNIANWHADTLQQHLSTEAQSNISQTQIEQFITQHQPLGKLQSLDNIEFSRLTSVLSVFSSEGKIGYSARAYFDNGSAIVTVTLIQRRGSYTLYNFNLGNVTFNKNVK